MKSKVRIPYVAPMMMDPYMPTCSLLPLILLSTIQPVSICDVAFSNDLNDVYLSLLPWILLSTIQPVSINDVSFTKYHFLCYHGYYHG